MAFRLLCLQIIRKKNHTPHRSVTVLSLVCRLASVLLRRLLLLLLLLLLVLLRWLVGVQHRHLAVEQVNEKLDGWTYIFYNIYSK